MVDYVAIDKALIAGELKFSSDLARAYAANYASHPQINKILEIDKFSMLAPPTLLLIRAFSLQSRTGILEVGPYVGGSTVAFALGVRDGTPKPLVSVDVCGSYLSHPHVPSEDIFADWHKNVSEHGVAHLAKLCKGFSHLPEVRDAVMTALGGATIDLLFFDGDGHLDRVIETYIDLLSDDCLLIFDDHHDVEGAASVKELLVNRYVSDAVSKGLFISYAEVPWSTWFGRLNRRSTQETS